MIPCIIQFQEVNMIICLNLVEKLKFAIQQIIILEFMYK